MSVFAGKKPVYQAEHQISSCISSLARVFRVNLQMICMRTKSSILAVEMVDKSLIDAEIGIFNQLRMYISVKHSLSKFFKFKINYY